MTMLRPECVTDHSGKPSLPYDAAYFRVMQAVAKKRQLIHGRLHYGGQSCAIGSAFDDGVPSLPSTVIDEIAAYNDSFPKLTPQQRWKRVMSWLRWKNRLARKPRR